MTNYRRGVRAEYDAVARLRSIGWTAQRTAGSHGPFDVIAVSGVGIKLIQIKSAARYHKPTDDRFRTMLVPANVQKEWWLWTKGKGWTDRWIVGRDGRWGSIGAGALSAPHSQRSISTPASGSK